VLELTVTIGNGFTKTVVTVEPKQAPLFPTTVKEVVVVGETIILFPIAPLLQVYVVAPVEVRVAVWPEHIVGSFTDNDKLELITMFAVAEFIQPNCSPVTV
jgi:hypothetical protein